MLEVLITVLVEIIPRFILRLIVPGEILIPMEEERSGSYFLLFLAVLLLLILPFVLLLVLGFDALDSLRPERSAVCFGAAGGLVLLTLAIRMVLYRLSAPEKGTIPDKPEPWVCPRCGTLNLTKAAPCTRCGKKQLS